MSRSRPAPPVEAKTLGSQVYASLRDDIIRGALAPGQRLTLGALKSRYGIGATPLREALYRLSMSLLVQVEDQRGFRVTAISPEHLDDVVAARNEIETLVLRDAIRNSDLRWEADVLSALYHLKRTPMYEDDGKAIARDWEVAHRNFHRAILAAAKCNALAHFQAMLWDHAARYRNLVKAPVLDEEALNDEHDALTRALIQRDEDLACLLLQKHILTAAEPVQQQIRLSHRAQDNRLGGKRGGDTFESI